MPSRRRAPRALPALAPRALSPQVSYSQAFVQHYYAAFDAPATRASLATLYQPQSMLTFEGSKLMARRKRPRRAALSPSPALAGARSSAAAAPLRRWRSGPSRGRRLCAPGALVLAWRRESSPRRPN